MAKKKPVRDRLGPEELESFRGTILTPGLPYQWVLTYGWVVVGFYVDHLSPVRIRLAHANYYLRSERSHAEVVHGEGGDIDWRYWGNLEVSAGHVLAVSEYHSEVPRGPVRVR